MKRLLTLAACTLFTVPVSAQSTVNDCAQARDPVRCEARQAALIACADKHGAAKHACLDTNMPPVDCNKAQNPQHCETAERAKEICKGKEGRELKSCLKAEAPKKARKKTAKQHHAKASLQR